CGLCSWSSIQHNPHDCRHRGKCSVLAIAFAFSSGARMGTMACAGSMYRFSLVGQCVSMSSDQLSPGVRLGKYKVLAHVATGGMGTIYKASDEERGRIAPLKVLDPNMAEKPAPLERSRREARHAAKLSHKNIVTLYEYNQINGVHFLALEFVDGIDLYDYIER